MEVKALDLINSHTFCERKQIGPTGIPKKGCCFKSSPEVLLYSSKLCSSAHDTLEVFL